MYCNNNYITNHLIMTNKNFNSHRNYEVIDDTIVTKVLTYFCYFLIFVAFVLVFLF